MTLARWRTDCSAGLGTRALVLVSRREEGEPEKRVGYKCLVSAVDDQPRRGRKTKDNEEEDNVGDTNEPQHRTRISKRKL